MKLRRIFLFLILFIFTASVIRAVRGWHEFGPSASMQKFKAGCAAWQALCEQTNSPRAKIPKEAFVEAAFAGDFSQLPAEVPHFSYRNELFWASLTCKKSNKDDASSALPQSANATDLLQLRYAANKKGWEAFLYAMKKISEDEEIESRNIPYGTISATILVFDRNPALHEGITLAVEFLRAAFFGKYEVIDALTTLAKKPPADKAARQLLALKLLLNVMEHSSSRDGHIKPETVKDLIKQENLCLDNVQQELLLAWYFEGDVLKRGIFCSLPSQSVDNFVANFKVRNEFCKKVYQEPITSTTQLNALISECKSLCQGAVFDSRYYSVEEDLLFAVGTKNCGPAPEVVNACVLGIAQKHGFSWRATNERKRNGSTFDSKFNALCARVTDFDSLISSAATPVQKDGLLFGLLGYQFFRARDYEDNDYFIYKDFEHAYRVAQRLSEQNGLLETCAPLLLYAAQTVDRNPASIDQLTAFYKKSLLSELLSGIKTPSQERFKSMINSEKFLQFFELSIFADPTSRELLLEHYLKSDQAIKDFGRADAEERYIFSDRSGWSTELKKRWNAMRAVLKQIKKRSS